MLVFERETAASRCENRRIWQGGMDAFKRMDLVFMTVCGVSRKYPMSLMSRKLEGKEMFTQG